MKRLIIYLYVILLLIIFAILILKIKFGLVIAGYFRNEYFLLCIFALFPILYWIFSKNDEIKNSKLLNRIAYFPIIFFTLHIVPFINLILFLCFTIPYLGYEKEYISEIEHFRLEKVCDIISSGGQGYFEVYKKGIFFDTLLYRFYDYKHEVKEGKFYEENESYKLEYSKS